MNGFSRAGIHLFSKLTPLKSNLIRNPLAEVTLQPLAKKKRGPSITGKILVNGVDQTPILEVQLFPMPASFRQFYFEMMHSFSGALLLVSGALIPLWEQSE